MKLLHLFITVWLAIVLSLVEAHKGGGKKGGGKKGGGKKGGGKKGGGKKGKKFHPTAPAFTTNVPSPFPPPTTPSPTSDVGLLDQNFTASFFIVFTGPQNIFNESNTDAIRFLENSIVRAFNLEIFPVSDRFLTSVTLDDQFFVRDISSTTGQSNNNERRRLQDVKVTGGFTGTGNCDVCGSRRRHLLGDSNAESTTSYILGRRSLQQLYSIPTTTTSEGIPVTRFEDRLVRILTNQNRFRMFLSIIDVDLFNTLPPNLVPVELTASPTITNSPTPIKPPTTTSPTPIKPPTITNSPTPIKPPTTTSPTVPSPTSDTSPPNTDPTASPTIPNSPAPTPECTCVPTNTSRPIKPPSPVLITQPPSTEPPITQPPGTEPPGTEPPNTDPPGTETPGTETPITQSPDTEPPITAPPSTEPPFSRSPTNSPVIKECVC